MYMRKIVPLIVSCLTLLGNEVDMDLDSLLQEYMSESDLSNETKTETGTSHLVIYTRQDLENRGYQSLKDLLNVNRLFGYRESRIGITDIVETEPLVYGIGTTLFRVFIDNHEIASSLYGTSLFLLGDIELDFIDHVEIYQGAPSYELSLEPSIVTVKLYSRTPERDNGNRISFLSDNYGTHKESFYTSSNEGDLKYFIYALNGYFKKDKIDNDGTKLSKDERRKHLFSSFNYKKNNLSIQLLSKDKDAFLTNSIDATPLRDDLDYDFLHLAYKRKFLDDESLELKMTYDYISHKSDFLDDKPFFKLYSDEMPINSKEELVALGVTQDLQVTYPLDLKVDLDANQEIYNISDSTKTLELQKKYTFDKNSIFTGLSFREKRLKFKKAKFKTALTFSSNDEIANALLSNHEPIQEYRDFKKNRFSKEKIYSAYIQDTYTINSKHKLSAGVKVDHEDSNYYKDDNLISYRISHSFKNKNLSLMTYYSYMPITKAGYLYFNDDLETELENQTLSTVGHEIKYRIDDLNILLNIMRVNIDNLIIPTAKGYVNYSGKYSTLASSIKFEYKYGDNELIIEPWRLDVDFATNHSHNKGLTIMALNRFDKFNIMNELIYRDNKMDFVETSMQYNLAVNYSYSDDLKFFVKGENILADSQRFNYKNYKDNKVGLEQIDKRYSFGIEYLF